jgi:phytoene/squalene synthetase
MFQSAVSSNRVRPADLQAGEGVIHRRKRAGRISESALAVAITREASSQTYYTIHLLADKPLAADAYRAYAYFRWVDDVLDQDRIAGPERLAFLTRQEDIIARCYQGETPADLRPEEQLVVDLIHHDRTENSGLRMYITQMMAVMAFDAGRKGRSISQIELSVYTSNLAAAVTEALHYFIGHDDSSPRDETRYDAVTGAHITHMLRDAIEDAAVGYVNVPKEYLETHGISPTDFDRDAYRAWVYNQVQLARGHFARGRRYLARVENFRCRLAGYAYIARFEVVLDAIEKDGYRLRLAYPERKSKKAGLKMLLAALRQAIRPPLAHGNDSIPGYQPVTEVS